ncbi:MAG: ATP-binding protein [Planctomycetota bacterium]
MTQPAQGHVHDGHFERSWMLLEERDSIEGLQSDVNDALLSCGYGEAASFAIRLALEEALVNGFRHGNKGNPSKHVTVDCKIDSKGVELIVSDEGEGFDPGSVPDPTADENIDIPSGRGIMLMRAYMSSVEYLHPGNRLRIFYSKPDAS